jgi:hypothetical protein
MTQVHKSNKGKEYAYGTCLSHLGFEECIRQLIQFGPPIGLHTVHTTCLRCMVYLKIFVATCPNMDRHLTVWTVKYT